MPPTTLATAEAHADKLVRQLRAGRCDAGSIVARLKASGRPYFTWAAAWAVLSGVVDRRPGDEAARAALDVLRAVEPIASEIDGELLARQAHRN